MKEEKDHLKKLFSDFEPEVSSDRVDEGWEKMRYFLPQEKKRRSAAYFFGCLGVAGLLLALLTASVLVFNYRDKEIAADNRPRSSESANVAKIAEHHAAVANEAAVPEVKAAELKIQNRNTEPLQQQQHTERKSSAGNTVLSHAPKTEQAGTDAPQRSNASGGGQKPATPHQVTTTPAIAVTPVLIENAKEENDPDAREFSEAVASACYLPQLLLSTHDADSVYPTALTVLPQIKPNPVLGAFWLQVFGGPAYTKTVLNDLRYTETKTAAHLEASAGVALGYQFRNRVEAFGQFVYSGSTFNYAHALVQTTTIPFNGMLPSHIDSSLITTSSRLSSATAYNIGLGLGYQLCAKRSNIGLTGFVLVNWRSVKYTFTEKDSIGVQAPLYTFSPQSYPPAPAGAPRSDTRFNKTVSTLGITAGLALSYRVYKNLSVMLRPSYCLQWPGNKGAFNNLFDIKRNTLYLDLGLQLRIDRLARALH